MIVNGTRVYLKSDLVGIRVWAQFFRNRVPRFDLYYYLGSDKSGNLHFFRARAFKTIIWKRWEDLIKEDFRPFLLDLKKIIKASERSNEGVPGP